MDDRPGFDQYFKSLGEGEEFEVSFRETSAGRLRSIRANNYLWGVVYDLMEEHTGQIADDIHDAMCERFLPNEHKRIEFFNNMTGESLTVETDVRRSSKLHGGKFYDFVEEVRMFARDFLGVDTPDPDPSYWRHRKAKAA